MADDAGHHIVDGALHERLADFGVDEMLFAAVFDEKDFRHCWDCLMLPGNWMAS
jgi:hypothetical protein